MVPGRSMSKIKIILFIPAVATEEISILLDEKLDNLGTANIRDNN